MGEGSSNKGSSNSVSEQWSSNSGRPTVVVQKGSSNSVSEQCFSNSEGSSKNSGRQTVVVQEGSSMNSVCQTVRGRP